MEVSRFFVAPGIGGIARAGATCRKLPRPAVRAVGLGGRGYRTSLHHHHQHVAGVFRLLPSSLEASALGSGGTRGGALGGALCPSFEHHRLFSSSGGGGDNDATREGDQNSIITSDMRDMLTGLLEGRRASLAEGITLGGCGQNNCSSLTFSPFQLNQSIL